MHTPVLKPFLIDGHHFEAEDLAQGYLVNPLLPESFDNTPNDERSEGALDLAENGPLWRRQ